MQLPTNTLTRSGIILLLVMAASLLLHLWLIPQLYIVEDESAYLQDAAQIRTDFLPFREFGATKGPFFLVLLKFWQVVTGQTIFAGRLFSSLAHVASIPLLYVLTRNLTGQKNVGLFAAAWWAVATVAVSLTTNIMHIPLELLLILGCLSLLSASTYRRTTVPLASLLFFLALLTRATAVVFAPAILFLLVWPAKKIKPAFIFAGSFIVLLAILLSVIYPLYGWPKTAFFFNADATLIAQQQRVVYAKAEGTSNIPLALFKALLPVWRDSLPLLLSALLLPFAWRTRQPLVRVVLAAGAVAILIIFGRAVVVDTHYGPANELRTAVAQLCIATWAIAGASIVLKPDLTRPKSTRAVWLVVIWLASFIFFYRGWGRSPTPFYPLESIPALCIAAALVCTAGITLLKRQAVLYRWLVGGFFSLLLAINLFLSYQAVPTEQYRGTVEVAAAQAMAKHIRELVPAGEQLFTAQPVYAYLSEHPVYLGLTHPGWYLAERAGFMPPQIRRVFFPDFDQLAAGVARDINWIVFDWRTSDVYFNGGTEETKPFRDLLENDFEAVVTVPNPASRDIVLYQRKE